LGKLILKFRAFETEFKKSNLSSDTKSHLNATKSFCEDLINESENMVKFIELNHPNSLKPIAHTIHTFFLPGLKNIHSELSKNITEESQISHIDKMLLEFAREFDDHLKEDYGYVEKVERFEDSEVDEVLAALGEMDRAA
jgi:hypothetical protein